MSPGCLCWTIKLLVISRYELLDGSCGMTDNFSSIITKLSANFCAGNSGGGDFILSNIEILGGYCVSRNRTSIVPSTAIRSCFGFSDTVINCDRVGTSQKFREHQW